MADGIHTPDYGYRNLMSFNEKPNILVDSISLPNKPLSNLEIIDAAKKL